MKKKYYRPDLTAAQNGDLFYEELLDDWKDRTEDLRQVAPPDSAEEYFALLLLKNRFERLPEKYQGEVAPDREWVQAVVENLTDAQITEAVNLFEADYWRENLKEASEQWLDEEIGRVEMFDRGTGFMDDLDGFGASLAYGTKRGLCSLAKSPRWNEFFACCRELDANEVIPVVLDRWVQSAAMLIREDIDAVDYETACIVEYFEPLLDRIEFREHQERGDRTYQEYLLSLIHSIKPKNQAEEPKILRIKQRTEQIRRTLYGQVYAPLAAAQDEEPMPERFFLSAPASPYSALVMFEEEIFRIRFYRKDKPELASDLIGRTVHFCGISRVIEPNGEVCFKMSECGEPITLEVDETGTGSFIQWVKE